MDRLQGNDEEQVDILFIFKQFSTVCT